MVSVLDGLLSLFPFAIKGFHSDNGSRYVNGRVASMLAKFDAKGKVRRTYPRELVATPYDALKPISGAGRFLKLGVTFEALAESDIQSAKRVAAKSDELSTQVLTVSAA